MTTAGSQETAPNPRTPLPLRNEGDAAPDSASKKIRVTGLDFCSDSSQTLEGNEIEMHYRTIAALIGPSGYGSSTIPRTLNRMNDEVSGSHATVAGEMDSEGNNGRGMDSVQLRNRIGMVFQPPNPLPRSIFDDVAYGPRMHSERRRLRLAQSVETSMRQAASMFQDTAFFHTGEIVEVGPTEMMFANPDDFRTEDYILGRFV